MPPATKNSDSVSSPFDIDPSALHELISDRDEGLRTFRSLGGQTGLAKLLKTDPIAGLTDSKEREAQRREVFGINELPPPDDVTFFELVKEALEDRMMQILIVSAILSLILGLTVPDPHTGKVDYDHGWIEGTAILVSVCIVTMVTSLNNYQKEQKFKELSQSGPPTMVTVTRAGGQREVKDIELLVGDVMHLEGGMIIPADGVLVQSSGFKVDESAATGENDEIEKSAGSDPFVRSGSNVLEGSGTAIVTGVGVNSFAGHIAMECRTEKADTPLQEKLAELADLIGYMGMGAAGLMFVVLTIKELYLTLYLGTHVLGYKKFLDMLTTSVTIVVVAVPEGLPLSVTIALAYSMKQMMYENNLVRHLAACETMGGATTICTDKTGTLTQNEMTVMRGLLARQQFEFTGAKGHDADVVKKIMHNSATPSPLLQFVAESISLNSTAAKKRVSVGPGQSVLKYVGNKTEQAMLLFVERFGLDPQVFRAKYKSDQVHAYPFTSAKKRMTTCVKVDGALRHHVKGASEMVVEECRYVHTGTSTEPITEAMRQEILLTINTFARNRLRTIAIAYADEPGKDKLPFAEKEGALPPLTLLAILGIEDPIRPEVEGAVARCKSAGVAVRMVTGDNKATAISIAKKAGIYGIVYSGSSKGEQGLAMEGKVFRELAKSEHRLNLVLPRLQVLARASPLDKQILVNALMKRGEVVAVTGDGTNDAPALKNANVGFAMNTGTEVAKKASDVVILDDNFRSIVTAMKWGRNVNDNISKFIQFQTTVNVAAVFIAFVGAITSGSGESPLKPVQLLWLNLIMDTMAALALATEPPHESVLDRLPRGRDAPLITNRMWTNILGQAAYQIALQLWLLNAGFSWFRVESGDKKHMTIIFNVFVLLQVTNEFNARILDNSLNVLKGLTRAPMFLAIIVITSVVQYIGVTFAGTLMHTVPLNAREWRQCILVSIMPLPLGFLLRMIPVRESPLPPKEPISDPEDPFFAEESDRRPMDFHRAAWAVVTQLKVVGALASQVSAK